MTTTTILGVLLRKRTITSPEFQAVISKHGCIIKTRIGVHNTSEGVCLPEGVILLDLIGTPEEKQALENDLRNIDGAEIQKMVFEY